MKFAKLLQLTILLVQFLLHSRQLLLKIRHGMIHFHLVGIVALLKRGVLGLERLQSLTALDQLQGGMVGVHERLLQEELDRSTHVIELLHLSQHHVLVGQLSIRRTGTGGSGKDLLSGDRVNGTAGLLVVQCVCIRNDQLGEIRFAQHASTQRTVRAVVEMIEGAF